MLYTKNMMPAKLINVYEDLERQFEAAGAEVKEARIANEEIGSFDSHKRHRQALNSC